MPLYKRGGGGSGLPEGGAPGQVLGADEDGNPTWTDPGGKNLFRGAWAPDALVWSSGTAIALTPPFSTQNSGHSGIETVISTATVPPSQPYVNSFHLRTPSTSNVRWVSLSLDVVALGFQNLTQVKFWHKGFDGFSSVETFGQLRVEADGLAGYVHNPQNGPIWVAGSMPLDGSVSQLKWTHIGTGTQGYETGHFITGIELYASDEPYMLGEFVTHAGEMWRSKVDNNVQTPSKTATAWEAVLALPSPSGTTAARPAPATAGAGFPYFDTTLNKPIWSTGTAWVDATGAAV